MFNPVHKIKKFVKNPDGSSYWYEDIIHGWLSTGIKDKNGREIFEGDKVNFMNDFIGVVSRNKYGEFIFKNDNANEYIVYMVRAGIEIVDD